MNSTNRNAINWFEIAVTDIKQAAAFYGTVTGQALEVMAFDGRAHAVFSPGPTGVHGALVEQAMQGPSPRDGEAGASDTMSARRGPTAGSGGTVIYLDIADGVAKALDRASKAGGKIVQPRQDLGQHGECALIEDRDGNLIGLHTGRA